MDYDTLVSIFWSQAEKRKDITVLQIKTDGEYCDVSWSDLAQSVREIGAGLITCGMEGGDRVGLLSANRRGWIEAGFGIMSAGGITVPLYAPLTAAQVKEQFADCEPTVVFVSTADQRDKLLSVRNSI